MRAIAFLAAAATAAMAGVSASITPYGNPVWGRDITGRAPLFKRQNSTNPFEGRALLANPEWAAKLDATQDAFLARGDLENADKVRAIRQVGTFVWASDITSGLGSVDRAIAAARAQKQKRLATATNTTTVGRRQVPGGGGAGSGQVVGLVLYNIPNRDCSGGQRAGELQGPEGLGRYKTEYIAPLAERVAAATDLTFAVVVEPDALANLITNQNVDECAEAAALYEEGVTHAISQLQYGHVHLYLDAAHSGWLGQGGNLEPGKKGDLFPALSCSYSLPHPYPYPTIPRPPIAGAISS